MIARFFANNRGVALLLTLSVIAVLVPLTMELNRRSRVAADAASLFQQRQTTYQMAVSGVHLAMALLVKDKRESSIDALYEGWADPETLGQALALIPFPEGELTLEIEDELAKLQPNALVKFPAGNTFQEPQKAMWDRILRILLPVLEIEPDEDTEPTAIINSMKDWLDNDDDDMITGFSGAESDYYQGLDPPYACRNAPLGHPEELLLIKGFNPALLYGKGEIPGLLEYITVFGISPGGEKSFTYEGRININTADLPVLAALVPSEDPEIVQAIYDYREENTDAESEQVLSNPQWYRNAPGCRDILIDPSLISTSSDVFRIRSQAVLNGFTCSVTAVVQRIQEESGSEWTCKILSFSTS